MARRVMNGENRYATAAVFSVNAASNCHGWQRRPSPISTKRAPAAS